MFGTTSAKTFGFGTGTGFGGFGGPSASVFAPTGATAGLPVKVGSTNAYGPSTGFGAHSPTSVFAPTGTTGAGLPGTTNAFSTPTGFGMQPSTSVFAPTSTTAGSTNTVFGSRPTGFGAPSTPFSATTSAFGATPTPGFGTFSTGFGATTSTTTGFGTGTVFGTTGGSPYHTTPSDDRERVISISAMPNYKNKSVEEIRLEDYQAGRNKKSGITTAGATGVSAPFFGTGFGTPPATNTGFGTQSPGLGTTPAPAPVGFLTPPSVGITPAPASPFIFGNPTPTPTPAPASLGFGITPTPAPASLGFGITPTPTPAPASLGFGITPTPTPAPASLGFGFTPTVAPSLGATLMPAPAQGFGIAHTPTPTPASLSFGITPTPTPAPTSLGFGITPTPTPTLGPTPTPALADTVSGTVSLTPVSASPYGTIPTMPTLESKAETASVPEKRSLLLKSFKHTQPARLPPHFYTCDASREELPADIFRSTARQTGRHLKALVIEDSLPRAVKSSKGTPQQTEVKALPPSHSFTIPEDYFTNPPIEKLCKMSEDELKHIPDFEVGRTGQGSVIFLGLTDIRNIDIEKTVIFDNNSIDVYPGGTSPTLGTGLNKPAIVSLIKKSKLDGGLMTKKLQNYCANVGAEFIGYNETTGEWKFKVSHF